MSGRQFHVTLPSNVNQPGNTIANYVTALPNTEQLDGEWEVALVEIAYPVNWHNLSKGKDFQWFNWNVMVVTEPIRIPEGWYESPVHLVDAIRTAWLDYWEERERLDNTSITLVVPRSADDGVSDTLMSIRFDEKTNKFKLTWPTFITNCDCLPHCPSSLRFGPILGLCSRASVTLYAARNTRAKLG
jgi:hypothetical protein